MINMKKVIVCGTRFGQFYIESLLSMQDVKIVGILAHGSERSRKCADFYDLRLFTEIGELPDDIDIACVAVKSEVMGGSGTIHAKELMNMGINVIFEQPLHVREAADCYNTAKKNGVKFVVADLYSRLPAVECFVKNAGILMKKAKPLFVNIEFASQVSYPLVSIISDIFGSASTAQLKGAVLEASPFQTAVYESGGTEFIYTVHNENDKNDIDGYLHLFFKICIGFSGGRLTLEDPHGSVIWQPRVHFPDDDIIPANLGNGKSLSMKEKNIFTVYSEDMTHQDIFMKLWRECLKKDIENFTEIICSESAKAENIRIQDQLMKCTQWQKITKVFGYPSVVEKSEYVYMPSTLLEVAERPDTKSIRESMGMLNKACCYAMLYHLRKNMTSDDAGTYNVDEVIAQMGISAKFKKIILRWLRVLNEEGYLSVNGKECCFKTRKINESDMLSAWKEAELNWSEPLGSKKVFEYFFENVKRLDEIMSGKLNPTWLLFPEGSFEIADALYSTTGIAREHNRIISEEIFSINSQRDINILEIGAGTGSTSMQVCGRLDNCLRKRNYTFTDISEFFLSNARSRFRKYDYMDFCRLDIDGDFSEISGKKDVIIAVGVINNARSILSTLKNIYRVLEDDGYLFIVEAIGESSTMLVSQAFMMSDTDDSRSDENLTFLTKEQWRNIFAEAGFSLIESCPDSSSELAVYNQELYILRKKENENV